MDYFKKKIDRIKNIAHPSSGWQRFAAEVRANQRELLGCLGKFENPILVSGCQRSGSTMMAGIIARSDGMATYRVGEDEELDAARVLSGAVAHEPLGRYCFQTTYLNERYGEYFEHDNGYKLIWMLRNPESVVYSMVYHWSDFALNELFCACGLPYLSDEEKALYSKTGLRGIEPVRRAALAYVGKVSQIFELVPGLGADTVIVVEYDDFVRTPEQYLPAIYRHVDIPYRVEYLSGIARHSVDKRRRLNAEEGEVIRRICEPTYEKARAFAMARADARQVAAHRAPVKTQVLRARAPAQAAERSDIA